MRVQVPYRSCRILALTGFSSLLILFPRKITLGMTTIPGFFSRKYCTLTKSLLPPLNCRVFARHEKIMSASVLRVINTWPTKSKLRN
ncbi:MAG: hypothetical protein FE78DRAFT_264221 [Acidomyces sp. 'richmondensis']|nr:MAG: hypothetical protein FE78DRAFT_264221 [Acidomyces sp. 'richmondensis']